MNHFISILFRAIPLAMALVCFGYGAFVFWGGNEAARLTAGPVLFFLGSVCLALFATAATIIRQIIGTYNRFVKWFLPVMGYSVATATLCLGICMFAFDAAHYFVAGHVVAGLGLIALCVSTAATASTRFSLIPVNSSATLAHVNPKGFTAAQCSMMIGLTVGVSIVAWVWGAILLFAHNTAFVTAGLVLCGIAAVCTSLIALVVSIARQVRGSYKRREKRMLMTLVLTMGSVAVVGGVVVATVFSNRRFGVIGYVLIGLGLICLSISSKVILLAKIWRAKFALANRIPLIPVLTALACLFLSAFLFEASVVHGSLFVPARVLVGLGAICFTLFSIVSILESGTSKQP